MNQPAAPICEDMNRAVAQLEACFEDIYHNRMQDIPIINPALHVESLGFRPWQQYWLGTLITPWFLNLVLLPSTPSAPIPTLGQKTILNFPAGPFSFIGAHEDTIGPYMACSLMSPLLTIDSQQLALETAQHVLDSLMDSSVDTPDSAIDEPQKNTQEKTPSTNSATMESVEMPSRRRLLGLMAIGKKANPQ
jgi:[NiFe] hydrogenase assembly HybE family chaperone